MTRPTLPRSPRPPFPHFRLLALASLFLLAALSLLLDMREAALAQRVIAMSDGGIIADGTPKEVFRQVELLRSVGLNVPETTQLLYSLEQDGFRLPLDALSVEECAEALYAFLTSDR